MRTNFAELTELLGGALLDKQGEINKGSPLYSQLRDLIFFNLLPEDAQQAVSEFIQQQHSNYEDVGMTFKGMFDVLKRDKHIKTDPEEDFFSGLLDDSDFEAYGNLKKNPAMKDWNARKYYELAAELGDRKSNPKRALLARLFRTILEEDKVSHATNLKPQRRLR